MYVTKHRTKGTFRKLESCGYVAQTTPDSLMNSPLRSSVYTNLPSFPFVSVSFENSISFSTPQLISSLQRQLAKFGTRLPKYFL